jgi:hypothetical protein
MKISVIVPTVLGDFPVYAFPDQHIFDYVPNVITKQDFDLDEMEVIIVDPLWGRGGYRMQPERWRCHVRHIAPPYSAWVIRERRTNHALLRNVGLQAAKGELIFLVDDTISFDKDMLSRVWEEHQRGNAVSPLVTWWKGDEEVVNSRDWRWEWLKQKGKSRWSTADEPNGHMEPIGYGIIAFPREVALQLGGYDQAMDAGTQLTDTTFGVRLAHPEIGKTPIVIDTDIHCRHEAHEAADPRVIDTFDASSGTASTFTKATHCNRCLWHTTKVTTGIPKRVNQGLSLDVKNALAHCPFYEDHPTWPAGLCSANNFKPCEVPHLARQGMSEDLMSWLKSLDDER